MLTRMFFLPTNHNDSQNTTQHKRASNCQSKIRCPATLTLNNEKQTPRTWGERGLTTISLQELLGDILLEEKKYRKKDGMYKTVKIKF